MINATTKKLNLRNNEYLTKEENDKINNNLFTSTKKLLDQSEKFQDAIEAEIFEDDDPRTIEELIAEKEKEIDENILTNDDIREILANTETYEEIEE